jgi:alanyl-tRNA synthetase
MTGDQIRELYTRFFEERGHLRMPSASLIPAGDPTLLFTSAGMVPFKPFFMGEQTPPNRRLTSIQKSFRTTDIDEVGDHKHLTFFEMLGNFSIGDYFKNDAVAFAWELMTQGFGLEADRLFVTVHLDDDEAYAIWHDEIGIPPERIYRYGDSDNWWGPAGTEGPTGPCSEMHYDGGAEKGCNPIVEPDVLTALLREGRDSGKSQEIPGCHPNCDCERFVELWNLVFMQFYQDPGRNRTPLPAPSVDTGMGLERAAAVLQEKSNIFETDLLWPMVAKACELTGKSYAVDLETDYALRVVAEHSRAATFLIGDGVVPGNEGRGYVLRRVVRRAIRYGRRLGLEQPFLTDVAEVVLENFRGGYRELLENHDFILRVIRLEEERFADTYERGISILDGIINYRALYRSAIPDVIDFARQHTPGADYSSSVLEQYGLVGPHTESSVSEMIGQEMAAELVSELAHEAFRALNGDREFEDENLDPEGRLRLLSAWGETISGKETFVLYDTYGFPVELTAEIAREAGLEVDMDGFQREMDSRREQSRAAQAFTGSMEILSAYENLGVERTRFVGYQDLRQESVIAAIMVEGESTGFATQGQGVEVVLQETPFYAEGGGQVGDHGAISSPSGLVRVEDTQSPVAGVIVHRGVVARGDISLGERVTAEVDIHRRLDAARNHSGTHLLHASLRSVLGAHVRQAGSYVGPERLRFDFSHVSPLSPQEIQSVQSLSNDKVREDLAVSSLETTYTEAVGQGALAFFGDRYGDVVRVVSMSNGEAFSVEVCGGTHVSATGQIGTMFVLGESSIGGGMRRIEAVTGRAAEQLFVEQSSKLDALSQRLQTPVADLEARLESFIRDNEDMRRRLAAVERTVLRTEAEAILGRVADVDGVKVVAARTSASNPEAMREMGDFLKARLRSAVVMLGCIADGNPLLVAMLTPDLVDRGLHAGNLARDTARVMGGGGGGRPEIAQAGGRVPGKLDEALSGVAALVRQSLT